MFAGQAEVHLPHSVQEYASINCFHDKSVTSFAPNFPGFGSGVTDAFGSSINFTSLVTEASEVNSPLAVSFAYHTFGKAKRI